MNPYSAQSLLYSILRPVTLEERDKIGAGMGSEQDKVRPNLLMPKFLNFGRLPSNLTIM